MFKSITGKVFTSILMLLFITGFAQAQIFSSISGTVTYNGEPMAKTGLWVSSIDTVGSVPVWTDANGNYFFRAIPSTYTVATMDTFSYVSMSAEVLVENFNENLTQDFELTKRTDLVNVSGVVNFEGNPVETPVYFLKVSDDTDLDDFTQVEVHFNIPFLAARWASYQTKTDAKGGYDLEMLAGKYVMHVPAGETSLAYWFAFEVTGPTNMAAVALQKMTTIAGTVSNTDDYLNIMVYAHSVDAGRPYMAYLGDAGAYTLKVAPGEYLVRVIAFFEEYMYSEFYTDGDPAYLPKDAKVLTVDENGLLNIDFVLPDAKVYDFTIKGMVTSVQSGKPIVGANVNFVSNNVYSNLWRTYGDSTNEKGMFEVNGKTILLEDSLIGFAWANNFFAEFFEDEATFLTADPIVYTADGVVEDVNFALDTLDTENNFGISGMVIDEEGNPLTSGVVSAYTTATNVGVITTQIAEDGTYAFDSIFPTNSTVYVQAWSWGYLPELYNEAASWEDADAITVESSNIGDINFSLTKFAPTRLALGLIKGNVSVGTGSALSKSANEGLEGATVLVRAESSTKWTGVDFIDDDGTFELPIDKNGNYVIKISAQGYQDKEVAVTVDEFSGSAADISLEPTAINPADEYLVTSHQLFSAYPNPFNPTTTIKVEMVKSVQASLIIYNVLGQKVKTLHNGILSQGLTKFNWSGTDDLNNQVTSGLYFYQLKTKSMLQTKAVMFLK